MPVSEEQLLRILRIGHDTSNCGEGISLRHAIERSEYRSLRCHFEATDFVPLLKRFPDLVHQWSQYSQDKRTQGGFALEAYTAEAVAEYVVRELDFWVSLRDKK